MKKYLTIIFPVAAIVLLGIASNVFAGTGGTEFEEIYTTLRSWSQGFLGKTIALGLFIVGTAIGIVRQSLMAIAVGIGGGMGVYYAPNIIDTMVQAMIF